MKKKIDSATLKARKEASDFKQLDKVYNQKYGKRLEISTQDQSLPVKKQKQSLSQSKRKDGSYK